MEPTIQHVLGPNPFLGLNYDEQNFNLIKGGSEIGCLEGAYFPGQSIFLISGIIIYEGHIDNGYSLKLLSYMSDEYQEPVVLLYNLTEEDFWEKTSKKKIIRLNSIEDVTIEKVRNLIENEN